MKQNLTLGITIVFSIVLATFIASSLNQAPLNLGQITPRIASSTASSSAMTVGNEISVTVLSLDTSRDYASLCNVGQHNINGAQMYLGFTSTKFTATSSASVTIPRGECYTINEMNPYVGQVEAMYDNATSSDLLVTEF